MPQDKPVTEIPVAEAPIEKLAGAVPAEEHPRVSAEDFCRGQSATDKRVELIGAFFSEEMRNGRHFDIPEKFAERLRAFADRPVPSKGSK